MAKPKGRPSGRLLHSEAFEAIRDCREVTKRYVADEAGVSPQFIADLLAHRAGASPEVAGAIAGALKVPLSALFPEAVGWIGPLPDRDNVRATRRGPRESN